MEYCNHRVPYDKEVGYFASLLVMRVVRVMRVVLVIRVLRVVLKIIKLIKNAIHLTLFLITFVLLVFGRIPVNSSHFSLYFVSILSPKYVLMCSFNKRNCIVDKSLKIIKLITLKMQSV
jgi:hypothetical protein